MKQEMLLPKLRLPGQTNWVVRGLWIFAGVAATWVMIVGATLWRRNELTHALGGSAALSAAAPAPVVALPAPQPASTPVVPAPAAPVAAVPVAPAAAAPTAALGTAARPGKPGVLAGRFAKRGKTAGGLGARKGGRYVAKAGARRGSKSLAARKALAARSKRVRYARVSANANKAARPLAPVRRTSVASSRPAKGGDAIDDILKNFK